MLPIYGVQTVSPYEDSPEEPLLKKFSKNIHLATNCNLNLIGQSTITGEKRTFNIPFDKIKKNSFSIFNAKYDPPAIEQWETWSQKNQQEQRNIALIRLKNCIENRMNDLDLTGLSLTELPENLPNIKTLKLSNNQFRILPENLPTTLEELNIDHNNLYCLPESLPSCLKNT